MKCVGGVAAMRSRVREWLDNLVKLDDRAGPAMSHDQRRRVRMRRSDVDKMDAETVDRKS